MIISASELNNVLLSNNCGGVLVKLTTTEDFSVYSVNPKDTHCIMIGVNQYALHLKTGDILVKGHLSKDRHIHNIDDLAELKARRFLMLSKDREFKEIADIPGGDGYTLVRPDRSLIRITRGLVQALHPTIERADIRLYPSLTVLIKEIEWDGNPSVDWRYSLDQHVHRITVRGKLTSNHDLIDGVFLAPQGDGKPALTLDLEKLGISEKLIKFVNDKFID